MTTLQIALSILCAVLVLQLVVLIVRDVRPGRATYALLALVEVGLVAQLVLGLVRVFDDHEGVSVAPYVGYLVGALAILVSLVTAIAWLGSARGAVRDIAQLAAPPTNFLLLKLKDLGLAIGFGVALVVSVLTAWSVTAWFTRRVRRSTGAVVSTAGDIAAGQYDVRIDATGLGTENLPVHPHDAVDAHLGHDGEQRRHRRAGRRVGARQPEVQRQHGGL